MTFILMSEIGNSLCFRKKWYFLFIVITYTLLDFWQKHTGT